MKCRNCGGELIFQDNMGFCQNCGSTQKVDSVFENTDVCICYIENDTAGRRTKDSIISAEVYKELESKNISTFYEHISAADIVGDDLETLRGVVISRAKIIVLVGTCEENFSVLYNKYADNLQDKKIIPVISDIKPEQLPEKLRCLQALNFDAIGSLNDLSVSILNILGRGEEVKLEEFYNKKTRKKTIIAVLTSLFAALSCFTVIMIFLFGPQKESVVLTNKEPTVVLTNDDIYNSAIALVNEKKFLEAAIEFNKIIDYKDSSNQIKKIYDRYDGYYQDAENDCSLYLNIIDGKTVEFSFEKIEENKVVKTDGTMLIENNKISGKYVDSLSNEGNISVELNNDFVELIITTKIVQGKASFGNINIHFRLENKTDRPQIRTVSKEELLSWITNRTYVEDIKASGYELEYIDNSGPYDENFGTQYKIANTDIIVITSNYDLTKDNGEYIEDLSVLKDNAVVALLAPADFICSEKIDQSACVFSKKGIVYVPNATMVTSIYNSDSKTFLNFMVDGGFKYSNTTDSRTMSKLTITANSMIGISSKKVIGDHNYNTIVEENKKIYYRTLTLQQYHKDNPGSKKDNVLIEILSEKENALLICIHKRSDKQVIGGTAGAGSYNYYRFDLKTKKARFIVKEKDAPYYNLYGSLQYSYEGWKNSPELFDEFLSQEESEEEEELEYESAEGEIRYVIATDGVDLKKQESEDSESILKIPFGQQVWIMPMNDLWAYVEFDGEIGYCALEHLSSDNPLE